MPRMVSVPIETGVRIENGQTFFTHHPYELLAAPRHAREVAAFGGWHPDQVAIHIEDEDWPEGDQYFPCDSRELYVLNARLIMN